METATFTSGVALVFGLLHALEPGHGKTAMLAYLASGKRTWAEGLVLSLTSAITHSLAVFCIAFGSHYLFHHAHTEAGVHMIGETLSLVSGALIIGLGTWIIYKGYRGEKEHSCSACGGGHHHDHEHHHDHDHGHGSIHSHQAHAHHHDHSHADHTHEHQVPKAPKTPKTPKTPKKLLKKSGFLTSGVLGIATGIIPCPTVVVAYLSGLSTGNSLLGVQNVLLFALGMSLSLMAVVLFFTIGGVKIREKLKPKKTRLNWNYVQGSVFVAIGVFTALVH